MPRVVKAIAAAGTYEDTSVWVEGQRRWVWLKGCVASKQQALDLEQMVRLIDDVEAVIPQLVVGARMKPGAPVYRLAQATGARPDAPATAAPASAPDAPAMAAPASAPAAP